MPSFKQIINKYIEDVKFVKKELCVALLIVVTIFVVFLWIADYPDKTTFVCSKSNKICTLTSWNIFNYIRKEHFEFDKITNSYLEDGVGTKSSVSFRYSPPVTYYYYEWVLFYRDNGQLTKKHLFRSSDYDYLSADKSYDRQYKYYNDVKDLFNAFLKDKTKTRFYAPNYISDDVRISYWENIMIATLGIAGLFYLLFLTFGVLIPWLVSEFSKKWCSLTLLR